MNKIFKFCYNSIFLTILILISIGIYSCTSGDSITVFNRVNNKTTLNLSDYELDNLPVDVNLENSLEVLNLSYNNLKEIPARVYKLKKLKYLDLRNNKITSIPNDIQNLTELKVLYLTGNLISSNNLKNISSLLPNTDIVYSDNYFGNYVYIPKVMNIKDALIKKIMDNKIKAGNLSYCKPLGELYQNYNDYERAMRAYLLPSNKGLNDTLSKKLEMKALSLLIFVASQIGTSKDPVTSQFTIDKLKEKNKILYNAYKLADTFCKNGNIDACSNINNFKKWDDITRNEIKREENRISKSMTQEFKDLQNTMNTFYSLSNSQDMDFFKSLNDVLIESINDQDLSIQKFEFEEPSLIIENESFSYASCMNEANYQNWLSKADKTNDNGCRICAEVVLLRCLISNKYYKEAGADTNISLDDLKSRLDKNLDSLKKIDFKEVCK